MEDNELEDTWKGAFKRDWKRFKEDLFGAGNHILDMFDNIFAILFVSIPYLSWAFVVDCHCDLSLTTLGFILFEYFGLTLHFVFVWRLLLLGSLMGIEEMFEAIKEELAH